MSQLPPQLLWLADVPLFIDRAHVDSFHDAVVQPDGEIVEQTQSLSDAQRAKISGKLTGDLSAEPGALATLLSPVFAFFKPKVTVGIEAAGDGEFTHSSSSTTKSRPIVTPQRLLVELTVHYLVDQTDRLLLIDDPSDPSWRTPEVVSAVPRALAFLDLKAGTKLIPTAAEFQNGKVQSLYDQLQGKDGSSPPPYPEEAEGGDSLQELRMQYWNRFDSNFVATQAMQAIENMAGQHGRIQWIDYRLPLTSEGDTLHLHLCPGGEFDTGVFAYNLVKRGFKHGIRIIGTLKSEPDMNVLAVFEK